MAERTFHSLTLPGQDTARVPLTAVEFNTSTAYKVKDYCTYQGKLYRCTVAHAAGAWNASHFTETDIDAELDRKLDIPPSQGSAPANPRVGDLWIDNDENSPIYNVDAAPTLGSTNAVQSGGTKTALNAIDSRKVEHGCITGDFSASVDYRVGDLVFYATTANGITTRTLYRCTTAHNATAWNAAHFTATTLEVELQRVRDNEADTDMIGDLFGAKTTYAVGDYCIYNDNLYRCIQAVDNTGVTTPAFDPDDWTQVALANDVSDLKSALNDLPLKNGVLLNNSSKFVAPYNDFDTFTQNECVLITTNPTNYVTNVPSGFTAGWVLTFNYKNVATGGLAQIVFYATSIAKGRIAWRKKWGSTWNSWYYFDNTVDLTNTLNTSISAVSQDATSNLVLRGYNEVTNVAHLNLTDANDAEVNRVYSIQASNIVANLPLDAYTGGTLITLNYKDTAAGKIQLLINNTTKTLYYRIYWSSWSDWFSCATKNYVESAISAIPDVLPNLYSAFQTIGVIGDSLASGECYDSEGHGTDIYSVSWLQFMCREEGITGYNFSRGGLTSKTWITDAMGYTLASDPSKKCKAYIIGLGQNDANVSMTIGTISDIDDSDYTHNADSYYGNYGGIIQRMKVIQPDAKFFLITDPLGADSQTRAAYNVAIRAICEHFTNCYLIDLEQDSASEFLDTDSYIYKNKVSGHYTATSYKYMSNIIAKKINSIMYKNPDDFKFVQFIGE